MEHMESKMQDHYDAWDARERETYSKGFEAGVREAANILRSAADDHRSTAGASKRVVESGGSEFAARLLAAYANGLEMRADNVFGQCVRTTMHGRQSVSAAERSMLLRVWQFLDEEADQRASVGSDMSDYAREPRELADEVQGFLNSWEA